MKRKEDYKQFLKPDVVSKLGNMELIARLVVEGFIVGLHKSPYHGFSAEFAEHRPYNFGDSPKFIDWKLYAKSDRYYVKEFEEETNTRCYIILDKSASMNYSSHTVTKFEYGAYLAAALSYLMNKQQDAVGLILYDDAIRENLRPSSTRVQLFNILKRLQTVTPGGETRILDVISDIVEGIKKRSLVILISDLLEEQEEIIKAVKQLRYRRNEILLFHIIDPKERFFDFPGEDPESWKHEFEQKFEGVSGWQVFFDAASDAVFSQLDVGHVMRADEDPAAARRDLEALKGSVDQVGVNPNANNIVLPFPTGRSTTRGAPPASCRIHRAGGQRRSRISCRPGEAV